MGTFMALHCAVVGLLAQSVSSSVFYIGAYFCDILCKILLFSFPLQAAVKGRGKQQKCCIVLVHVKPTN